ncbi:MAG: peptidase M3, partial [Clostridia bacterium]|nr:peptidase M3 [Clostridia bacterium]
MYHDWSLQALYPKNAAEWDRDIARLEELIQAFKEDVRLLSHENARETLRKAVDTEEEISVLTRRLGSYFHLRRSVKSRDLTSAQYSTRLDKIMSKKTKPTVAFHRFIASLENLESVIQGDEVLEAYHFRFSQIRNLISHKLSDEAEDVFARMNVSGGKSWSQLFSYLTSNVAVEYKDLKLPLSAVRRLAESDDAEERKTAYEAELACYGKIKDSLAFALNSIKAQVNTEAELRGYESPLAMTLEQSRMKKETLDAMLEAMREAFPKFREYLRHKAKLLGYPNGLPWYEILAPMGKADAKTYTPEEAHAYLVEHFSSFAPDLAELVDTAFRDEWIDFYPHEGKAGGAFCSNLPFLKQSRILTNFSG